MPYSGTVLSSGSTGRNAATPQQSNETASPMSSEDYSERKREKENRIFYKMSEAQSSQGKNSVGEAVAIHPGKDHERD